MAIFFTSACPQQLVAMAFGTWKFNCAGEGRGGAVSLLEFVKSFCQGCSYYLDLFLFAYAGDVACNCLHNSVYSYGGEMQTWRVAWEGSAVCASNASVGTSRCLISGNEAILERAKFLQWYIRCTARKRKEKKLTFKMRNFLRCVSFRVLLGASFALAMCSTPSKFWFQRISPCILANCIPKELWYNLWCKRAYNQCCLRRFINACMHAGRKEKTKGTTELKTVVSCPVQTKQKPKL